MRGLTAVELLEIWENGSRLHPIDRVLSLLLQVTDRSHEELAALPVSQRDALLLALRKATFGDELLGKNRCPQCNETVEFALSCSGVAANADLPRSLDVEAGEYRVTIRPLNSYDLAAAAGGATLKQARETLLSCSVAKAYHRQKNIEPERLPADVRECIAGNLAGTDPQAEILVHLSCPDCDHDWQGVLDIGHILWLEIMSRARRLLMEVHLLAKAYGWSEKEIFALSDQRRAAYLQMVTP